MLSHIWLSGTNNRWHWDESAFREIFHFGKWIFLSGILGFLAINSDRLMLGGMVGTAVLGVYMIAFNIFNALEQVLSRVTSSVTFPALSEIARERPGDLKEKYYRIHAIVAAAAYFCSGALMMSGEALIGLLYDRRYVDAGWMLEILAIGLLTVPIQVSMQCFAAIGMPQIQTRIHFVRLVSLVVATPLGFHIFGLPGALWGLLSSSFFCLPPIIFYSIRHKIFDVRRELLALSAIGLGIAAGKVVSLLLGH
jgi:O-antigen/teichoic acid export membrane protein